MGPDLQEVGFDSDCMYVCVCVELCGSSQLRRVNSKTYFENIFTKLVFWVNIMGTRNSV